MNLVRARNWYIAGGVFLCVQVLVSTTVTNRHTLAAFGDMSQALMLGMGTVFFSRQIFHAAGPSAGGWTIMAVHESKASWERFRDGILVPKLQAGIDGGFPTPPEETEIDVANVLP